MGPVMKRGVGTAIESMLDNLLEACSAAQMVVLGGKQQTPVILQTRSFVLGDGRYTYGILGVNLLVTLIFVTEAVRTRWWKEAPRFDFVDLKAVILNGWVAGNSIVLAGCDSDIEEVALNVKFIDRDGDTGLALFKRPEAKRPHLMVTRVLCKLGRMA
ncbi:hypothetical protein F5Y15DRAFT_68720 [Xylariaceae sp. FL0016]|nr:hypothetical protein F5Y15DRAFT_68720 [Xylariaceae sp. FL0016]